MVIVGEGGEQEKVISARKKASDLYWLPYEGNARKLASIYATSDLLVHASLCETFGLVVLEAQSCGTPAIAFRGSGMEDLIFGGPEFIADEQNPASLAKAVLRSYQNDLREVGARCRESVVQRYPWKSVFKGLIDIYAELKR